MLIMKTEYKDKKRMVILNTHKSLQKKKCISICKIIKRNNKEYLHTMLDGTMENLMKLFGEKWIPYVNSQLGT